MACEYSSSHLGSLQSPSEISRTVKALLRFLAYSVLLAPLVSFATASPGELYNDLSRRQSGTYDGTDDDGTGHPGTFHCFRGGTWMKQAQLSSLWDQACTTEDITDDTSHFDFNPTINGQYSQTIQYVNHTIDQPCITLPGPLQTTEHNCPTTYYELDMSATLMSATHANSSECEWAFARIIDICHGQHLDSRGGWWQFQDDGTTYGIDPNYVKGGQHQ